MDNYNEVKKNGVIVSEKIKKWKPREFDSDINSLKSSFADFTPEKEAVSFCEYWIKKNYGSIGKQLHHFSKKNVNEHQEAGRLKKIFNNKNLLEYRLIRVEDKSPAISEITIWIKVEFNNVMHEKDLTLRFIFEGPDKGYSIMGDKEGQWRFIENFYPIELIF